MVSPKETARLSTRRVPRESSSGRTTPRIIWSSLRAPTLRRVRKIIDNQPVGKSNLEPYYFLALCHEQAGETESAKAIFSKILAENYNFRDVRKWLGQQ